MAQYLVLIYEDEAAYATATPEVFQEVMAAHQQFGGTNGKALLGGNALEPTATATSIRRSDAGQDLVVTDGPFAETKEALGGYYLIEAPDLDAAIAIAKQVPARFGGVEVRPIRVFD
ncbi:MAG: YciI family protein [Acidimicrobiaceae bacterium]|nr:YciI family protein [Acidimicrobiaceae bacterium]